MRNLVILLLLLFITAGYSQAEKSLLWKISGNGLEKPSYLFGTIHITCDATLSSKVLDALDKTSQLYLELDMDNPALSLTVMKYATMNDGSKLSTLATKEDYDIVSKFVLEHTGISISMLDNFKPVFIDMMLIDKMLKCPIQSVEAELMKVTKTQHEEVFGLETVEDQMAAFEAVPYQKQMDELVKKAKEGIEPLYEEYEELMDLYKQEDITAIMEYVKANTDVEQALELLNKRNENWIPVIEATAKNKPTFYGVGTAHLPGKNGVINLLRKKGYIVEAVK
ncbi:TraB/GumN family protein [Flavobacterium sp. MK4S-17]|uniref:TraB/GumN family protein n=1 Tax=Flavobacterium sp. MK4S-17 TaxID=2543737 RepID=UPI00135B93EF|nr:TraB/GumN family protein [Flavobacterium sp. MK4S-17]